MTSPLRKYSVYQIMAGTAAVVFLLLLVAPWFPPNVAVFLSVALFIIGSMFYVLAQYVSEVTIETADKYLPEIPDEKEERNEIYEAYLSGKIDEEEMERQLEEEMQ